MLDDLVAGLLTHRHALELHLDLRRGRWGRRNRGYRLRDRRSDRQNGGRRGAAEKKLMHFETSLKAAQG